MTEDDEGLHFLGALKERFNENSRDRAAARAKRERRASMTPAQRRRKGPPKTQVNFRATAETKAQIEALAEHLVRPATEVIALAIDALAKATPGLGDKE